MPLTGLKKKPSTLLVLGLVVVVITGFAGNSLITRAALAGDLIGPALFAEIRLASGAAALLLVSLLARKPVRPTRIDWLGGMSLMAYTIAFSFAYLSLDAGTGALILFAAISTTVVVWSFRSGPGPRFREVAGLILAFGGVAWLVSPAVGAPPLWAALLMAGAGIAFGTYTLVGRGGGDPVARSARNFLIASVLAVPFLVTTSLDAVTLQGVVLALICGIITTGAAYALWYTCLPYLPIVASGSVQLLPPAVATLGGIVLLGEPAGWRLATASLLIIAGVALTLFKPKR